MTESYIRYFSVIAGSITATQTNNYLCSLKVDIWVCIAVSAVMAALIYKLLEYALIEIPLKIHPLRKMFDSRAIFEGTWLQATNKDGVRYYSFEKIIYDKKTKTYAIEGESFDSNGDMHSAWKSNDLKFDLSKSEIMYNYKSEIHEDKKDLNGYGLMTFQGDINGKYNRGTGYYVDFGGNPVQCVYSFEKLTKSFVTELIGRESSLKYNKDIKEFIKEYHEKFGEFAIVPSRRKPKKNQENRMEEQ